ncbi:conserved membrane hypothetical protein [Tenacibaculum maritimum]|uniref:hypothetical protein n=1 Tax=Tenacibaculum maritimum TaxID=107401 RepID=UPI0012E65EE1|nr:hypothetical protein [Tenacibaculum maritimum]CAA0248218.1 conserved membrane hypothetical protein [Tenacibaculum maritimum]
MSSIPNILQLLDTSFNENWLDSYLESDETISDENKTEILSRIHKLLNKTIDFFFKSLISGEYILDTDKIINDIEKLNNESKILLNPVPVENFETQNFLLDVLKGEYIDILKIFSNIYLNFIKLVKSQNENPNIDIVYEANSDTVRFFNNVSSDNLRDKIRFFDLIILVYRIDHFFNDNVSVYKAINQLENNLKEYQKSEYHIAIKEKVNYLKFKWEIRQKSYKRNNFKLSKAYLIDDELFISTDRVDYKSSIDKLKKWEEYIECYYELDNWNSKLNSITTNFKHKSYESLTSLELLFLLKDFKDVNKDYLNLKEVVEEFEIRYKDNSNSEKRFLYNKTYLYAINNQFSALLEQNDVNSAQVKELKSHVEKIQKKCNIDNFFIDSKYISFRLNQINNSFENREVLDDLSKYKDELDELSEAIKQYKAKLYWSKNNHNLLFQLPYEECLVNSNIEDLDIFYASSIVLPLPHEESQEGYEVINSKLKELKQLVLSVASLNREFETIKNIEINQKNALEDLKNNQVKSIETITLFTAVIAFIITSIPSFSFVKDIFQAILFIGIIGSSLLIMLGVMFLFTRGFKKNSSWILITLSIVLFIFTILSLNNSVNKIETNIESKYIKKLDSLKITQHKIDSLRIVKFKLDSFKKNLPIKDSTITAPKPKNNPTPK